MHCFPTDILIRVGAPQGGWEADETVEAAAARETVEEAGVRGVLEVSLQHCQHVQVSLCAL